MTVAVVMGSDSDLAVMSPAIATLRAFGVEPHVEVVSAHRDPHGMLEFGAGAERRGLRVIIAGAGGAAHLPGMLASATIVPVIGVPVGRPHLDGLDSLLSIVQMPSGIPVATMAIDGAANAALLALRILGGTDTSVAERLRQHQDGLRSGVAARTERVRLAMSDDCPESNP